MLAEVWVPAAATTIVTANITDRRVTVAPKATATFIVAASDSEQPSRADWQCSGTDDDVQIQAALDALPATGGLVMLTEGTYDIQTTINLTSFDNLMGQREMATSLVANTALSGAVIQAVAISL